MCRAEFILYQLLTPKFSLLVYFNRCVFKNYKTIDTADIGKRWGQPCQSILVRYLLFVGVGGGGGEGGG